MFQTKKWIRGTWKALFVSVRKKSAQTTFPKSRCQWSGVYIHGLASVTSGTVKYKIGRLVWANSADSDQTAPAGAVWSGLTPFAVQSTSFGKLPHWKTKLFQFGELWLFYHASLRHSPDISGIFRLFAVFCRNFLELTRLPSGVKMYTSFAAIVSKDDQFSYRKFHLRIVLPCRATFDYSYSVTTVG